MRAAHPKMGAQMVLDALVEQGYIAAGEISASTMQRWFRRRLHTALWRQPPEDVRE